MKPLEPPDSHYLSAAVGWLGLGNVAEAGAELEKIAPQFQSHPDVLAVQFDIHAASREMGCGGGNCRDAHPAGTGRTGRMDFAGVCDPAENRRRNSPGPGDSDSSPADLSQGNNHRLQPGVLRLSVGRFGRGQSRGWIKPARWAMPAKSNTWPCKTRTWNRCGRTSVKPDLPDR